MSVVANHLLSTIALWLQYNYFAFSLGTTAPHAHVDLLCWWAPQIVGLFSEHGFVSCPTYSPSSAPSMNVPRSKVRNSISCKCVLIGFGLKLLQILENKMWSGDQGDEGQSDTLGNCYAQGQPSSQSLHFIKGKPREPTTTMQLIIHCLWLCK